MTNEQKEKLEYWQRNFRLFLTGQYDAAHRCESMNLWLGIPVVVLSAIVGTSVFASLAAEPATWAKILVGGASVLGAILAALQTYLRYSERAEKHRIAAAKFAALHKEVDQLLVIPLGDEKTLSDSMSSIRTRWDEISEGSPTIPESIWKKHKAIFDKGP